MSKNMQSKFLGIKFQHSSEYPALTSALNLLDEVFDLQARSQWLRRGLINRLLGELTQISSQPAQCFWPVCYCWKTHTLKNVIGDVYL